MMVIHKVQKSGSSYYVNIPRVYLESLGVYYKEYVGVILENNKIIIQRLELKNAGKKNKGEK